MAVLDGACRSSGVPVLRRPIRPVRALAGSVFTVMAAGEDGDRRMS